MYPIATPGKEQPLLGWVLEALLIILVIHDNINAKFDCEGGEMLVTSVTAHGILLGNNQDRFRILKTMFLFLIQTGADGIVEKSVSLRWLSDAVVGGLLLLRLLLFRRRCDLPFAFPGFWSR